MDISYKIELLRAKIRESNLDAFIIPSNDEFMNEYVPDYLNRLKFITGFTGSNGIAIISLSEAFFFTDGRYILQAKGQLSSNFKVINISDLYSHEALSGKIGFDPKLISKITLTKFTNSQFIATENLIDQIWQQKTIAAKSKIFKYNLKYSGKSFQTKKQELLSYLEKNKLDSLIINDPANICWLLNIRAADIKYNPFLLAYLIINKNGQIELFSFNGIENVDLLEKSIKIMPFSKFSESLIKLNGLKVQIDPKSSVWLINHFTEAVSIKEDPCNLLKACKNKIEIQNARRIHLIDGFAVSRSISFIKKNYHHLTERSVAANILAMRRKNRDFISPSFATIAGFKENGAIIHYNPTKATDKKLLGNGLLLIDSGGQYFGGTTDVTRVICIGKPTHEQKYYFTMVLKCHINLANCRFPKGTTGAQLDVLARYFLWQNFKDFAHGTGHGVGNCLAVHEGPQSISKYSNQELLPGMIISNEPGYYKKDEYGIRIENLMLVRDLKNGYLDFETITMVPLEKKLILSNLLNKSEKHWLDTYQLKVGRLLKTKKI